MKSTEDLIIERFYQEYEDALIAKAAAEQNFQWATNPEEIELVIKEIDAACARVDCAYRRIKMYDTPEKRRKSAIFKQISL